MRIPLTLLTICAAGLLSALNIKVHNLKDENHIYGPKLTEKDLEGKVLVVEVWGRQCPPCRASLPHMAKMAKKLEKLPAVVIGSHCQGRDDEEVISLLEGAGCEYSVYQFFKMEGEPGGPGIPYSYVVDHNGKVVWHGHPMKGLEAAAEEAAKKVPKMVAGSLINGIELKHHKAMARRLVVGQNIEGAIRQLEAAVKKGGAAGEEAQMLIDRCEEWAEVAEKTITENLETLPSKSLVAGKQFMRSFPTRSAELKAQLVEAAKNPLTKKLATSREDLQKLRAQPIKSDNIRKSRLNSVTFQLKKLDTFGAEEGNEDFEDVKAEWEAFASELGAE